MRPRWLMRKEPLTDLGASQVLLLRPHQRNGPCTPPCDRPSNPSFGTLLNNSVVPSVLCTDRIASRPNRAFGTVRTSCSFSQQPHLH